MLAFANGAPLLTDYSRAMQNLECSSWLLNKESVANELCEKYKRKENVQSFLQRRHLGFILSSPYTKTLREWVETFIDLGEVYRGKEFVTLTNHMQLMRAINKRLRLMQAKAEAYQQKGNATSKLALCDPCFIDPSVVSMFHPTTSNMSTVVDPSINVRSFSSPQTSFADQNHDLMQAAQHYFQLQEMIQQQQQQQQGQQQWYANTK